MSRSAPPPRPAPRGDLVASRTAGRFRFRKFSTWPLATRVVLVTISLSLIAIMLVGTYLSDSFAESLHAQRRERSLEQSKQIRDGLVENLTPYAKAPYATRMEVVDRYVTAVSHGDPSVFKGVAVTRVDKGGEDATITNNDALRAWVGGGPDEVPTMKPGDFAWNSVEYLVDGRSEPAVILRTVANVGGRDYELLFLYSIQQEYDTIDDVKTTFVTAAALMLTLIGVISVSVSRIVRRQLERAAEGAERISRGELNYRVPITGSDELARMGTSFNDMAASLERQVAELVELSQVQKRFVSDVSHELRTPLTTIKLASTVLNSEKKQFPPTSQRTTELLSEQVDRFQALLGDLLEMSRHDAGGAQLEARKGSFADAIDSVMDTLRPVLIEHGADVRVRHSSKDTVGVFDERRISRIVRNLVTNAVEHRMDRPIMVETGANDTAVAVVVQDFGVGLSPEEAERVFDRFWRANSARNRTLGGTGLGLAISQEDAMLHGGKLEVWGQKGKGSVFRLTLPRTPGKPIGTSPLKLERSFTVPSSGRRRFDL